MLARLSAMARLLAGGLPLCALLLAHGGIALAQGPVPPPVLDVGRSFHAAVGLPDGRVLFVGGWTDDGAFPTPVLEAWDPATNRVTQAGELMKGRRHPTATVLRDGRVLVTGGEGIERRSTTFAELFDPRTGQSRATGPMAEPRSGHTATLLPDGRVLIIGGEGEHLATSATAELWDPATGRFTPAGEMPGSRAVHTATLLPSGEVVVTGGLVVEYEEDGTQTLGMRGDVVVWNNGRFRPAGRMRRPRASHAAVALPDGRLLVLGGEIPGQPLPRITAACEICDPHRGRCASAGSMREPRAGHPAVLLPDGRIFIAGGHGARWGGYSPTTEIWEQGAGFRRGPPLSAPRAEHTATLLPDGRVLVAAGQRYHRGEDRLDFLATVELLSP